MQSDPRMRLLAALFACVLAIGGLALVPSGAGADETPAHPVSPQNRDAACSHCHENPHEADGAQFGDCAGCHAADHFAPSTFGVDDHAKLAFALDGKHTDVACRQCHASAKLTGLPSECAGCHIDRHRGILGEDCTECHAVTGFKPVEGFQHARSGFELEGPHASAACESCHKGENGLKLRQGQGQACSLCHQPGHGDIGQACESCHSLSSGATFANIVGAKVFDHRITGFPLERRHAAQKCGACHVQAAPPPDTRCSGCHVSPHMGQLGYQCQDCHREDRWNLARFDHDLAGFVLRGSHFTAPCSSCHTNQRWIGLSTECWDCHAKDAARAPQSVDAHRFGRVDCSDCHNAWRWRF
ncbi:MAG: cytochrome c3 family protein [Myxococcota bacterium]